MAEKKFDYTNIPKEKFRFVNEGEKLHDTKFSDKPIGFFKDAWIRFRKNKASVGATAIIVIILLYAFLTPLITSLTSGYDKTFMDPYYAKKGPRSAFLSNFGIFDGTMSRDFSDKGLIKAIGIGIGAEDFDGRGVSLEEGMASPYQPMKEIGEPKVTYDAAKKEKYIYPGDVEVYLEVGFLYKSIEQAEYHRIVAWQEETGKQVLYPLVAKNEFTFDETDANYWYKTNAKGSPVKVSNTGKVKVIDYEEGMMLEDNYKRDENGDVVYYEYTGGGNFETAQFKVRILYYNYYQFMNGIEPNYLFGTDSQGYDLALRMADGIQLSFLLAIGVSVINFIIGALYGAVEGYYGGALDLVMERISDVLSQVPFMVVATLFQMHLAKKVGVVPSLLFAFVVTGWIGIAYRVRTQFYRFKTQEYVMAARTLGARDRRIIWKHIFPNTLGTLITSVALIIPGTISSESNLSYLGIVNLGNANTTSLGTLLSDAQSVWTNYPHLMIFPAVILSLLMISFNLFGNGLRDAFNPSLRGVED